MIGVIVLYALLATTFPLAQQAVSCSNPLFFLGTRMCCAGLILLLYCMIAKKTRWNWSDAALFAQVILFHAYLAFVPEYWALPYLPALKVNILYCTTPFMSAFFEWFCNKKPISKQNILGMGICVAGMIPLFVHTSSVSEGAIQTFSYPLIPELVLLVAIASAAYAWTVVSKLLQRGYQPTLINGVGMLGGGIMSFVTYVLVSSKPYFITSCATQFLGCVLALIIVSNIIVYNLYAYLLKKYSLTFVSLAGFLCPLFGMLYAHICCSQIITWHYWLACITLTLGLWVFYKGESRFAH